MPSLPALLTSALLDPSSISHLESSGTALSSPNPPAAVLSALARLSPSSPSAARALVTLSLASRATWRRFDESCVVAEPAVSAAVVDIVLVEGGDKRGLEAAVVACLSSGGGAVWEALRTRDVDDWDAVGDGAFAALVEAAGETESSVLDCDAVKRRVAGGFEGACVGAGVVWRALGKDEGGVEGLRERFGEDDGFRLGAGAEGEDAVGVFMAVRKMEKGADVRAYVSERGWAAKAATEKSAAEFLAAAYVAAPSALSRIAGECRETVFERAVLATSLVCRGKVDEEVEASLRASQDEVDWGGAMRLRRIAVLHPLLLARRVAVVGGCARVALGAEKFGVAEGLIRATMGMLAIEGVGKVAVACAEEGVRVACGGGRAGYGVRGEYGSLCAASCEVLRKAGGGGEDVRELLARARKASGTESEVRSAMSTYLDG